MEVTPGIKKYRPNKIKPLKVQKLPDKIRLSLVCRAAIDQEIASSMVGTVLCQAKKPKGYFFCRRLKGHGGVHVYHTQRSSWMWR